MKTLPATSFSHGFCTEGKSFVITHLRECDKCRSGLLAVVKGILSEIPMLNFLVERFTDGKSLEDLLNSFLHQIDEGTVTTYAETESK